MNISVISLTAMMPPFFLNRHHQKKRAKVKSVRKKLEKEMEELDKGMEACEVRAGGGSKVAPL